MLDPNLFIMKNHLALLLVFVVIVSSCKKEISNPQECPDCPVSLSEEVFSPDFDWKSSKNLTVSIEATQSMIIKITSGDETLIFHKAYHKGGENAIYSTKLNIPAHITTIKINNALIEINGSDSILLNLNQQKSPLKNTRAEDEIVSYWTLDENSGTTISDEFGLNDGELTGGIWVNGISGSAIEFNGIDEGVIIPESESLDITEQVTLTAWAKTYENKEAKVAQKGDWEGINLGLGKWGGWKARIMMEDMNYQQLEWDEGIPLLDEWYFLALTYDGNTFKLFVNGALKASTTISGNLNNNSRDFCIGSDANTQKFFNGIIDEVGFYSHALSNQDILDLYNVMPNSDSDGDGIPDLQDNYPNDATRAFDIFWPSGDEKGSIAFEDLWPGKGDFDFNDLVLDFRFQTITNASNYVVEVFGDFTIKAVGASQHNGFGFQLSNNFPIENLTVDGHILSEAIINLKSNGTEADQGLSTIIVFDNSYNVMPSLGGSGVNVIPGNQYVEPVNIRISMDFVDNVYSLEDLDIENFNPFLIVNRNRSHEIHLPDYPPTSLMNESLFGSSQDDSDPISGKYFKTANNVPWAIITPEPFNYPIEKHDITEAHLQFINWAQSSGTSYNDWFQNNTGYRNASVIY